MKKLLLSSVVLTLLLSLTGCSTSDDKDEKKQETQEQKEVFYNGIDKEKEFNPAEFLVVNFNGVNKDAEIKVSTKDILDENKFKNENEYIEYKKILEKLDFMIEKDGMLDPSRLANGDILNVSSNIKDLITDKNKELSVNLKSFNIKVDGLIEGEEIDILNDYIEPVFTGSGYSYQIKPTFNLLINQAFLATTNELKVGDVVDVSYSFKNSENINDKYYFPNENEGRKEFVFKDEGKSITSATELTSKDFEKIDMGTFKGFQKATNFIIDYCKELGVVYEDMIIYKEDIYKYIDSFKLEPIAYYEKYEDNNYSIVAHYRIYIKNQNGEFVDTTDELQANYKYIRRIGNEITFSTSEEKHMNKFNTELLGKEEYFEGYTKIK